MFTIKKCDKGFKDRPVKRTEPR